MTDYKVLFLDIDGTILKPDSTIDQSTKDAISQMQQKGVEVFLATGRPLHEIADLAEELNVHSFIGYNGALAIYEEQTIVNEPMKGSTIEQFLEIAKNTTMKWFYIRMKKTTFLLWIHHVHRNLSKLSI